MVPLCFRALDERFISGTVGFFSSGMQDGVYFDKLTVESLPCEETERVLPPLPPQCSVFVDSYFSSVSALYTILDGEDKGGATGHWEYRVSFCTTARTLCQCQLTINPVRIRSEGAIEFWLS